MAEERPPPAPICVLKVNIQCCAACRKKIKKTLEKIHGVNAVKVDAERGLVSVSGAVDPSVLSQAIAKKLKKKVELYAYEKTPKQESKKAESEKCNVQSEGKTAPSHNSSRDPDGGHDGGDSRTLPKTGTVDERNSVESRVSTMQHAQVGDHHLPYNFYQNEAPARNNSILHSFCDENVNSCSIS
ncbi:hypothetical protein SLEP1_g48613 [Rubroshorea leprosula]|uniref:HMA domain-containing protein n=1 Tax=Rubroshorea leprosula TaxID=152421 RepID=A0AAV5LX22_9ROSI|nr:hypothetical protein SLEP1_g48613 [Rubroshorea leprosula]